MLLAMYGMNLVDSKCVVFVWNDDEAACIVIIVMQMGCQGCQGALVVGQ